MHFNFFLFFFAVLFTKNKLVLITVFGSKEFLRIKSDLRLLSLNIKICTTWLGSYGIYFVNKLYSWRTILLASVYKFNTLFDYNFNIFFCSIGYLFKVPYHLFHFYICFLQVQYLIWLQVQYSICFRSQYFLLFIRFKFNIVAGEIEPVWRDNWETKPLQRRKHWRAFTAPGWLVLMYFL